MAQTRSSPNENIADTERPSKRAKIETETDSASANAVDASLVELAREREESSVSDGDVEDTAKAAQGSDLYLDTVCSLSLICYLTNWAAALWRHRSTVLSWTSTSRKYAQCARRT